MLKRVTWRSWAVIAAGLAAYACLGYWLSGDGAVEAQLYKWGLLAASLAPLLLVAVYTRAYKWYETDLGSAIVQVKACVVLLAAPLAWVFFADGGMLRPGALAWIEVSAPALVALAILRLCWVFLRIRRDGRNGGGGRHAGTGNPPAATGGGNELPD